MDSFDINKISNAGFKLDFVTLEIINKVHVCEIEVDDITSKIEYWQTAIMCYVKGAHPLFSVLNGYIHRLWAKNRINKVVMLKNKIVLVRFDFVVGRDDVVQGGIINFIIKPFIVKAWNPDMEFTKEELHIVPIWVRLPGLYFKYLSPK